LVAEVGAFVFGTGASVLEEGEEVFAVGWFVTGRLVVGVCVGAPLIVGATVPEFIEKNCGNSVA
jgi:hypothetical protein